MKKKDSKRQLVIKTLTAITLIIFFVVIFFLLPPIVTTLLLLALLAELFFVEWPRLFNKNKLTGLLLFPIYPTIPIVLAIALNHNPPYRMLLFYLAVLVALFDIGSYFFGSAFGKNKIAPTISPRKSWEGAIGGFLVTTTVLSLILWLKGSSFTLLTTPLILGLIICTLALSGDLFESWLKRKAGVKDSADFLPGHGGVLDRFDGMLFVLPFFYLFKDFLSYLFGLV